ncbi:MAG: HK97 family phage prohead protease [Bauldia sp.]
MDRAVAFAPLEVKFAEGDGVAAGTFTGYGAIFGNQDGYGDVIEKGAFKDTLREWKKLKRLPPMLSQHGGWFMSDQDGIPVGKWTGMGEDENGLAVEGRLINLDTERGKGIYGAMKEGVLDGLSIGYFPKEFELGTKPEEPRRKLKKVELVEVSIVTFPANAEARVTGMKSRQMTDHWEEFGRRVRDGAPPETKEFEDLLRDAGVPKAMAVRIASVGYAKAIRSDSEGEAKLAAETIANLRAAAAALRTPS